jgi:uncharacterized RDD family membrane protein YckC
MSKRFPPLIGWRLLALLYDSLPALGLWFIVAALFTALHGDAVRGGALGWLELGALWAVTGLYATASWRRGGQTLGMRPWRLRLSSSTGQAPSWVALWRRYAVATLSLLLGGLGFWWAWLDRDGLTWHDRASATRLQRQPPQ